MSLGRHFKTLLKELVVPSWWLVALFASAGELRWGRGWLCTVLYLGALNLSRIILQKMSPELLREREPGIRQDTKSFDKVFMRGFLSLTAILPVIAGLDAVRFRWAPISFAAIYPGVALFLFSTALIIWTLVRNPHAESSVRIQTERDHSVVASGPYRFVRHPMYVGLILLNVSLALILGSLWTLAIALLIAILVLWRTAREDQTLRLELPGYEEYTSITRYRLMPGVW